MNPLPSSFTRLIPAIFIATLSAAPAAKSAVGLIGTVPVGANPGPVAIIPAAHEAFVVNRKDNTVSVVDTEKRKVLKVIPVGAAPVSIAAEPVLGMIYVANAGAGTITAINATLAASTWTVGGKPIAVVIDSVLGRLYAADASLNRVDVLDAKTGQLLATIPTGLSPTAMALNIATHSLFVACSGVTGSVVVINGQTNQILTSVGSLPAGLQSIAVDYATNLAVAVSPSANAHIAIDAAHSYAVTTYHPTVSCGPGVIHCVESPLHPSIVVDIPGYYFLEANDLGASIVAVASGGYPFGEYWGVHPGVNDGTTTGLPIDASAFAFNPGTLQAAVGGDILDLYFDPSATGAYHPLPIGPTGLAFDPLAARLVMTDAAANAVDIYDTTPETVVPTTGIGIGLYSRNQPYVDTNPATGMAYTARVNYFYATNEAQAGAGAGGTTYTAGVTAIPMPGGVSGVAVNSATNRIYVAGGGLYGVDGTTNALAPVSSIPAAAISILECAVDSGQNRVLALNKENYTLLPNALYILDGATDAVLKVVRLDDRALYDQHDPLLVDPARSLAYVVGSAVYVIDTAAGTIVATIPVTDISNAAALDPAASRLYVTTQSGVVVIDTLHNSIITTVGLPSGYGTLAVAANPLTGRFYVSAATTLTGFVPHVLVYDGVTNKLIVDLSGKDYPAIVGDASIAVSPLTDTIYVGNAKEGGASTTLSVAAIDGETNAVIAVAPSRQEATSNAMSVDLGSGVLAAAGFSYTNLFFPTSDLGNTYKIPIPVTGIAAPDPRIITTAPILRTRNPLPVFNLSVTSGFPAAAAGLAPTRAFFQFDGWQGKWSAATLKVKTGSLTATGQAKRTIPLTLGRHILYSFATVGDVATIQNDFTGGNSSVNGPISATVFTVER